MVKSSDSSRLRPCPCGGSQSCIVERRKVGDWVHEDSLMDEAGIKKRKNCFSKFTKAQQKVMNKFEKMMKEEGFQSIAYRWNLDAID